MKLPPVNAFDPVPEVEVKNDKKPNTPPPHPWVGEKLDPQTGKYVCVDGAMYNSEG